MISIKLFKKLYTFRQFQKSTRNSDLYNKQVERNKGISNTGKAQTFLAEIYRPTRSQSH